MVEGEIARLSRDLHWLPWGCRFRPMKSLTRNIGRAGRVIRAALGVILIATGLAVSGYSLWLTLALVCMGAFALFEAFQGWCLARACGIKTRL
jgi:hypothetical protein